MAKRRSIQDALSAGPLNFVLIRLLAAINTMACPACGSPHVTLSITADAVKQTADLSFGCKQCLDSGTLSAPSQERMSTEAGMPSSPAPSSNLAPHQQRHPGMGPPGLFPGDGPYG